MSDPLAYQAPLSMGFSSQEYWSGLLRPPSGDLPNPGMELVPPASFLVVKFPLFILFIIYALFYFITIFLPQIGWILHSARVKVYYFLLVLFTAELPTSKTVSSR